MQEKEEANQKDIMMWGVDKVAMETTLYNAFIHHAIDNRGVLTSPRRGRQVAAQILTAVNKFLAHETDEADIKILATQLAEQGMVLVTGTNMMRALLGFVQSSTETAVIHRLNDFQLLFLAQLATAREIVQQRFQETAQAALQHALHDQLEQQTSLHEVQKKRTHNLNQILQLNARLSQASDEATLLREAVNGICAALDIAHVTLFETLQPSENWRVITTTDPFLNQGDDAPAKTVALLATAFNKGGETVRSYQNDSGDDSIVVGIILQVGTQFLGSLVAHHNQLDADNFEEYLILVRTFAQNLAALWHNLHLLNETQQRTHELEILHGRYLDSIWHTPEATLQARADENNLNIAREMGDTIPLHAETAVSSYPLQIGEQSFGQIRLPDMGNLHSEDHAFVQDLIREMGSALNNAQFVQTTRTYSNQLRLAVEVSRAATTILDRNQLIRDVVELIRSRFNFYYVGLFLVDEQTNTAVLRAGTGEAGQLQLELNHSQVIGGDSMIGTAVASGEARVEQNILQATAFKHNPLLPETQAELALPLRTRDRVIGALTAQSNRQGAFSSETVTVLQSMADQLAIAIENANLFAQAESTLNETNQLYSASRNIGQAHNAYDIYKTLIDFAQVSDIAQIAQIIIADAKAPNFLITPVSWSIDGINLDSTHRFPREMFNFNNRIINTELLVLDDSQTDDEIDPYSQQLHAKHNIHAVAMIPIYIDKEWLGTLTLAHQSAKAFASNALQPFRTLADQAANILANQRLLRQTELLYRIGRALNQAITREDALGISVQEIQGYTGAHQCRFVLYEPGSDSGQLVASSNNELDNKTYHLPLLEDYAFERLSQEQKPLLLSPSNVEIPKETMEQHVQQFNAYASLLIPAASQQELIGYLAIDTKAGERPFTSSNLIFTQTVVDHLTTQLENIKLLDDALHRAQDLITLNQIQSNISRILNLNTLAKIIYGEIGRLLDNTIFLLAGYNPKTNWYEPILTLIKNKPITLESRTLIPGEPLYDFLGQDKHQLLDGYAPLMQAEKISAEKQMPQSAAWIPLLQDNNPIGLISVQSYEAKAYGESDVQLLRSIATQTSLSIINAGLFEQTQLQNEELRELDKLKTQFLANMSHELRTPLNSIIGFSRVILKGIDGPISTAQEEDLQSIHSNGQHLLTLINEILDMAKIDADKMSLHFEKVHIHEAIEPARNTMRSLINAEKIDFVWDVPQDLPEIEADSIRLRQIVLNLLSNAAKFTNEGEIRLCAYAENESVHLTVQDTGIGIAPGNYDLLFTPFAQINSSNTRTSGGTGLGLPITKWLIEMHHGSINFTSELNEGTTFHLILPVNQQTDQPKEIDLAHSTIDLVS
ncbi:MAG: GAF domain-containing protein [Chloroflexi bacterium]|nr:GAF domain-containing protein [Chloroflexota bacterium]